MDEGAAGGLVKKMGATHLLQGFRCELSLLRGRPIDSWVLPRVRRSEIVIEDERSPDALGNRIWFYRVDPAHDFAKVPNSEWTGTGRR
jgi:hypothetical protein